MCMCMCMCMSCVNTGRDPLACQLLHCLAPPAAVALAATLAIALTTALATALAKVRALLGLEPCPRRRSNM
jgi:hypothetical protein